MAAAPTTTGSTRDASRAPPRPSMGDIIALQEVDRGQARSGNLDVTAVVSDARGARYARFVPTLIGLPGFAWWPATDADEDAGADAYGIALISRFPVDSWHVLRLAPAPVVRLPVPLPGTARVAWLRDEARIIIAARVQTPVGPMTVAATHLSFVPGKSFVQLRRATRWLAAAGGPTVLMGDLNQPRALVGRTRGWRVLARAATYPAPRPLLQLDHVLGRGSLPAVRHAAATELPVSDHLALSVDLAGGRS